MPVPQRTGRARRALCQLRLHLPSDFADSDDPCRHERRCRHCGQIFSAKVIHTYGRAHGGAEPCEQFSDCIRCGHESRWRQHNRTRSVLVADLPAPQRRFHSPEPCDYAQVCEVCDEVTQVRTEHDWDRDEWGGRCRVCRELRLTDEA
ncbi:hypothetical protein ACH4OY_06375 [Micromonospora rubida]|uniref:C2H2-type domain-containing protein n=1 Tax=Micromonospora rubida TaxID=2697657 RepID=A0ABW7SHX1_9ACTN